MFDGGAPRAAVQSLLLRAVVETRQNNDPAVRLAGGFLFFYRHDSLYQTRDGAVNVGVILMRQGLKFRRSKVMIEAAYRTIKKKFLLWYLMFGTLKCSIN